MTANEIKWKVNSRQYEIGYWNDHHACGINGSHKTSYPNCYACEVQQSLQSRISTLLLEAALLGK